MSLTRGTALASRVLSGLWAALFRLYAPAVGGCRPLRLESFIEPRMWSVEYRNVVTRFAVPSEVLIAVPERTSDNRPGTGEPGRFTG